MRKAKPIADMLADLHARDGDTRSYFDLWIEYLNSIGNHIGVRIDQDGSWHMMVGGPVDPQIRHRNRWQHFLWEDLVRVDGRYEALRKRMAHTFPNGGAFYPREPLAQVAA
jgi:hypothetical protein